MGHGGLSRSRSRKPTQEQRKRLRSVSVAGEIVEREDDDFEEPFEESIAEPTANEKYRTSCQIVNEVLKHLIEGCKEGHSAMQLCKEGDELVTSKATARFARSNDEDGQRICRGLAFPTTVSVNEVVCHYSPLDEKEDRIIKAGDLVRFDVSCHIDGYIATAAHTILIPGGNEELAEKKRKVMAGAWTAAECVLRSMKSGVTNDHITDVIQQVAHAFELQATQGVLSHRMARYEEMGDHVIMNVTVNNQHDFQLQETICVNDDTVWSVDVCLMSVRDGEDNRLRGSAKYTTSIYRRTEVVQPMRLKSAHFVLDQVKGKGKAGCLPFAIHHLDDQPRVKFGLSELIKSQLVDPFPVMCTRGTQILARYKWTVFVTKTNIERAACGPVVNTSAYQDLLTPKLKALANTALRQIPLEKRLGVAKRRRKSQPDTSGDTEMAT